MQKIRFVKDVVIGFSQGHGYGNGLGPFYLQNKYYGGQAVRCVVRPRVGMPEYDLEAEKKRNSVDLVFMEEDLVAQCVSRDCFEMIDE